MLCTEAASESDEDGLLSLRTDPDELAEDLDALIDVLCVGLLLLGMRRQHWPQTWSSASGMGKSLLCGRHPTWQSTLT